MNWAREVALQIIKERPDEEIYTIASGVSPSGFVHIGNFREIATPYLVVKELKALGKKVRYILSWDNYDRYRKVPGGIPASYEQYIGLPYTEIPSPFSENETYAEYMQNRFEAELKAMDVEVEYIYQTAQYRSGIYNEYIKKAMDNRGLIFDIIDDFRTQDAAPGERESFYPISIYCPKCKKDTTEIVKYENDMIDYECSCGHAESIDINTATNLKLQWKVDWPMRWMYERVTFETGGADHSAANGSKAVSERIAREIYNYEPPIYIPYNFIGIKGGPGKMSSSAGNVLTLSDLLKVYDKHLIWWFYAKYNPMSEFDLALDNDVIRYYSEFDRFAKAYFTNKIDEKNKAILDLTGITEDYLKNPGFNYLATFLPIVNNDVDLLKGLLTKDGIDCENLYFDERLARAQYWVENYGADYQVKLLEEKNISFYETLSELEKSWVSKTIPLILKNFASSDDLQTEVYALVKPDVKEESELKVMQKRYFGILYNLLLGADQGPKLGLFLIAVDKEKIKSLLEF